MRKKLIILLFIMLALFPASFARSGSIKLLAVTEIANKTLQGSVVDMTLEIKDGNGKVFIESFPLTKLDTQITTRTAKQIACDYVGQDCSTYDFFYMINSSAPIVGGPSAGAATAVLTIAVLENIKINSSIAITGTINAGNIIGGIGGLKEKIRAASQAGIKTVFVPLGEMIKEGNKTISASDYGHEMNITIMEVSTLDEVMEKLTGKMRKEPKRNFSISETYALTMRQIAEKLCNRSTDIFIDLLNENIKRGDVLDNKSAELEQEYFSLVDKARKAMSNGAFYSAASYCYGAGLKNLQIMIIEQNLSIYQMNKTIEKLVKQIDNYRKSVEKWQINTISDLEAYMVVNERLSEANRNINNFYDALENGKSELLVTELASAISRFNSAKLWSDFYGKNGSKIKIDPVSLRDSCKQKLAEAEERYQYVNLYIPDLYEIRSSFNEAVSNMNSGDYAICLFLASKTKADVESVSSSLGIEEDKIDLLINQRLRVAKNIIAEQNAKGLFPILGYSYYEYATDLMQGNDTSSRPNALIYTGYALELSKLDIYLKEYRPTFSINVKNLKYALLFFVGFVFGVLVYDIIIKTRDNKNKSRSRVNSQSKKYKKVIKYKK